jgi:hypothetical protein
MIKPSLPPRALVLLAACVLAYNAAQSADQAGLGTALTFHASFDGGTDAEFALGDAKLYHAPAMNKRADALPGLPTNGVTAAKGQGRFGDALAFQDKAGGIVFFQAAKNMAYRETNWSGTVSFWLSTDPAGELKPGFADPIQITPRAWNDAAFFVEFEKRPAGIPFRLGAYADFKVWNPSNRKWEEIPMADKPLLTVEQPPFAKGKWTHVAFTFERFNSRASDGVAHLYLDGKPRGTISARTQTFTWDMEKSAVMLGLSYVGLFDELSLFNRALAPEEIAQLHSLPNGARSLLKGRSKAP